jgi:cyanate permease
MQLPVSFWLAWRGDTLLGRRWPYVLAGVGSIVGVTGYALAPAASAPVWAGLAGAAASLAFILNLGVAALFSPSDVARTSGLMFTIGYGAAFFGPALGGFAWDWTGQFRFALLPMLVGALAMLAFGATFPPMRVSAAVRPAESAAES